MTLALLCSGQGHQHPDMFALTADATEAAPVFAAATRALGGRDPRGLVRDPGADLHANAVGQVLCCTQALAAHAALRVTFGDGLVIAGYSVGELAAWGCAGLIEPAAAIDLARARAAAMDAAGGPDDGLAYVRGLARTLVEALCTAHGVAVAIINPADTCVLGGGRKALAAACAAATDAGATRTGVLKVAVASHTPRLARASETFATVLARQDIRAAAGADVRLLSGVDGTAVGGMADGLAKLARQVSRTINWAACLEACREAGATAALELGPGNALAQMTTNAYPDIPARSLDDFRTLAGVRSWLARALER